MSENHGRTSQADAETEVWNAIAAFEQILEVMPDDRSSLETLSHAYEYIGDQARALQYTLRLGEVVVMERDAEAAPHVIDKLEGYEEVDPAIPGIIEKLRLLVESAVPPEAVESPEPEPEPAPPAPKEEVVRFRVADELSFAWKLFEAGEISQDEYASVAHDLAELSMDGHLSTVSVLHALDGMAFSGMERVMGFVSRETKTPIVSLQSFELQRETKGMLSQEFVIRRGALVFGLLKDDALVVVMNPFDKTLRADIERVTGRKCHFFMSLPKEFDGAVASQADNG